MNIHEYQAKQLFERFGVATPKGIAATTAQEAAQVARDMGVSQYVVKAQVHAGGRGKGTFKNGFKGGVHVVNSVEEVEDVAGKMLNQVLVTKQTGEAGKLVSKIMVAEAVDLKKECYFAILQDRARECPVIVASTEGGMDIEEVAATRPEAIIREHIDPALGILPFQALKIAVALGLTGPLLRQATKLITNVYKLFTALDCSLVEINPLVVTTDDRVCALDAKFNFDDNALYRHPEIMEMRDETEEDPREVEAGKYDLNYIGLDGNIGCMVNGAGLGRLRYGGNGHQRVPHPHQRQERQGPSRQHLWRHHALRRHRPGHRGRSKKHRHENPACRPPGRHQRGNRQENPRRQRHRHHPCRQSGRSCPEGGCSSQITLTIYYDNDISH